MSLIERLEGEVTEAVTTLKLVKMWVTHWQADAVAGLKPTPESMADVLNEINRTVEVIEL